MPRLLLHLPPPSTTPSSLLPPPALHHPPAPRGWLAAPRLNKEGNKGGDEEGLASFPFLLSQLILLLLPLPRPIIYHYPPSTSSTSSSTHLLKKNPFTHYLPPFTLRDLRSEIAGNLPAFFFSLSFFFSLFLQIKTTRNYFFCTLCPRPRNINMRSLPPVEP